MRKGLYMFRHSKQLSQAEFADKIGCSRATYSSVETGKRNGSLWFWKSLQKAFPEITDADMWKFQRKDDE